MTQQPRVHLWTDDAGLTPTTSPTGGDRPGDSPAVFDSWIVDDGAAVAAEAHEERFTTGVRALFPDSDAAQVRAFLTAVRTAMPPEGRWWPRVEAHRRDTTTTAGPPDLILRIRPAPKPGADVVLWSGGTDGDAPRLPRHKGPDQPLYSELRELAEHHGATDAALTDVEGHVLETDHSALVWWRGETLCLPARSLPRLPSVTQEQLVVLAEQAGVSVRQESVRPAELEGLEVWAMNAARGIRPVTAWLGEDAPSVAAAGPAVGRWHEAWRESRADLSGR